MRDLDRKWLGCEREGIGKVEGENEEENWGNANDQAPLNMLSSWELGKVGGSLGIRKSVQKWMAPIQDQDTTLFGCVLNLGAPGR